MLPSCITLTFSTLQFYCPHIKNMSGADLYERVFSDLHVESIAKTNQVLYSQNLNLSLAELNGFFQAPRTIEEMIYAASVLILKLDTEAPQGISSLQPIYDTYNAIHQNMPALIPAVLPYYDSIISTEVPRAQDSELIRWAEAAKFIVDKQSTSKSSITAVTLKFSSVLWPKITEISKNPTTENLIVDALKLLADAKYHRFDLESLTGLVVRGALDFLEERNDDLLNINKIPIDIQEDQEILDVINKLIIQDPNIARDLASFAEAHSKRYEEAVKIWGNVGNSSSQQPVREPAFVGTRHAELNWQSLVQIDLVDDHQTTDFRIWVKHMRGQGKDLAVKIYEKKNINVNTDDIITEIECYQFLSNLVHEDKCFIRFYGAFNDGMKTGLVMDFYRKTLKAEVQGRAQNIINGKKQHFYEKVLMKMIVNLLISYADMEAQGIFQGDIKLDNILIANEEHYDLKIIDFSHALRKVSATNEYFVGGTEGYRAPEVEELFKANRKTGIFDFFKADVFSLGMVFFRLCTLCEDTDLNTRNKNQTLHEIINKIEYPWVKNLLKYMLNISPAQRPTFKDCLTFVERVRTNSYSRR